MAPFLILPSLPLKPSFLPANLCQLHSWCLHHHSLQPHLSILLLLPLCILVLYLGFQQWHQLPPGTTMSHSDVFTYHMVGTELLGILGFKLTSCGVHTEFHQILTVSIYLLSINSNGQTLFHILTCVERYLDVVHPITYLSLRTARGIRVRNVTIG